MNGERRERGRLPTIEEVQRYLKSRTFTENTEKWQSSEEAKTLRPLYEEWQDFLRTTKGKIDEEAISRVCEKIKNEETKVREIIKIKAVADKFRISKEQVVGLLQRAKEAEQQEQEREEKEILERERPVLVTRLLAEGFSLEEIKDFFLFFAQRLDQEIILDARQSRMAFIVNGEKDEGIFTFLDEDVGAGKNKVIIRGKRNKERLEKIIDYLI